MNKNIRNLFFAILAFSAAVNLLPATKPSQGQNALPYENKLINPGFEEPGINSRKAYGWQSFQLGYQRTRVSHNETWGIRLRNRNTSQVSGAYQRVDLNQTELKPVFIGGYVRGSRIKMAPGTWLGASLYAEIHLNNGSVVYWNSLPNNGSFSWQWIGFNTAELPAVDNPIDHIFVVPILGYASGRAYFDDITVIEFEPNQSAVTLMFDDGELYTYTKAKPVLDRYGLVGSSAIITNEVGTEGFMNWAQIKELATANWEILSHSTTHSDLTLLNSSKLRRELRRSKIILARQGLAVKNLALPYGAYNARVMREAKRYYASVRAYEIGDNPEGTFPYTVKVRSVEYNTTPEQVAVWLEQAKAQHRWVILCFHKITESGDDQYYVTPEAFEAIVQKISESGLPVITYNQGIELFGVKE